ncbi:hypothetical protein PTH_0178 [Pelotomaculum thermopropionicum SI]|uniref:Tyr recombinase domain-containing protein n=1 Tax=Pelotomaculum thermopropionicum (strain DSM 13744 / JCM 10971 / SI) TaxID=370438 RepID=A5D5V9_PELTS|nr:hypothetical protein PTH_0178 [Pelotomaculum thermopropionicum SI]
MSKKDDPLEIRNVSIYHANTYEKVRTVGMSFAKWLSEKRNTPVFRMVTVSAEDINNYVEKRLDQYKRGEITAATLQTDISCLKKIENLVNHYYGKVDWDIPTERSARREKWGLPKRERDKTTVQRGPAYTKKQADRIVMEVEKRYGRLAADALRFCRATGCRLESLVDMKEKGVRIERINIEAGTVSLLEKGGKWRTVKYDQRYDNFMRELKSRAESSGRKGPLFACFGTGEMSGDPDYSQLTNDQLRTIKKSAARRLEAMVKEIAAENGFHGRGIHGFRKEFAVRRHSEYIQEIKELVRAGDWKGLSERFKVSEQKARDMVASWIKAGEDKKERRRVSRAMDNAARLRLSKDLGHNRLDVTFAYVPRKK